MSELNMEDLEVGDEVELLKENGALSPQDDETIKGTVSDIRDPVNVEWVDAEPSGNVVVVGTEDDERELSTENGRISVVSVSKNDDSEADNAETVEEWTYTNEYHDHKITLSVGDKLKNEGGEVAEISKIRLEEYDETGEYDVRVDLLGDVDETTSDYTLEAAIRKGKIEKLAAGS